MISSLRQGAVIGQAWLNTQVYIHRPRELDAKESGQWYQYRLEILLSSIQLDRIWTGSAVDSPTGPMPLEKGWGCLLTFIKIQ